jgi:TPR repeat protein
MTTISPHLHSWLPKRVKEMNTNNAKKYILAEQFSKAKEILLLLAKSNDAEAQLILGYLYYGGDSDTSAEEAKYWLLKSCENGNAEAMFYIATTDFKNGFISSEPKDSKFFPILLEAANKGSADAQRSLAVLYANGESVPQDYGQTRHWDEMAAKQGLAESQHDLAVMLVCGEGGAVDIPKAVHWFEQAASKDHNVPYAQWAAEALANIYSGDPAPQYTDLGKSEYWKKRAEFLKTVSFRPHPSWFYEGMNGE